MSRKVGEGRNIVTAGKCRPIALSRLFTRLCFVGRTKYMLAPLPQFGQRLYPHMYNLDSAVRASDVSVEKILEV